MMRMPTLRARAMTMVGCKAQITLTRQLADSTDAPEDDEDEDDDDEADE